MSYLTLPEETMDETIPIATAIRIKPPTPESSQNPTHNKNLILNPNGCELSIVGPNIAPEKFRFDHVLPENTSQNEVFSRVLSPFLPLFFDGFDIFIIMSGAASSGKSYTLFGPEPGPLRSEADLGIIPRFVRHIFENYNELEMTIKVSSFEVTNDDISDSLAPDSRRKSLLGKADIDVEPATEVECSNVAEVFSCYESSLNVQKLKGGNLGLQSLHDYAAGSRQVSHSFFKVILEQRVANIGKKSSVTFVDLAPSDGKLG